MPIKKKRQRVSKVPLKRFSHTDGLSQIAKKLGSFFADYLPAVEKFLKQEISLVTFKNLAKHPAFGLGLVSIIWGASVPITKVALFEIGPASLLFLRMSVAAIILFPIVVREHHHFTRKEEIHLFLSSVVGIGVPIYLIYLALPSVTSLNVPVIGALSPFLLVILGWIFFRERIQKNKYYGMMLSFAGALVITVLPQMMHDPKVLGVFSFAKMPATGGYLIIILSCILGAIGTLLIKPLKHISGAVMAFWQAAIIAIVFLPLAIAEVPSNFIPTLSPMTVFAIFYVAVISSVVGYTIYNDSVHKLQMSEIGLLSYLSPVGALVIAGPLLHEMPDIWFFIGSILVILGVWIAEKKSKLLKKSKILASPSTSK